MIEVNDKKQCCGCGACAQACPQNCIKMTDDEEGFLYPKLIEKRCIGCNLCETVCPIVNFRSNTDKALGCYIAYNTSEKIRKTSSSGGLFFQLASLIIHRGGVVYGAAFDSDFSVHHIRTNSHEQLLSLKGSKYTQSRIENVYLDVHNDLKNGKLVVFSGTACQVAGLKAFLGTDHEERLLTIDLLCHGVPSPKVWNLYLKYISIINKTITHIDFRNKSTGWKNYSMRVDFEGHESYTCIHQEDCYSQLFLSNICLRPSCYDCKFKKLERPSDITLGDAWGVNKIMPEYDDDEGTSIILTHTFKGEKWLKQIESEIRIAPADVNIVLPPSADSRKSVKSHEMREVFFERMKRDSIRIFDWWKRYHLRLKYKNRIKNILRRVKPKRL